METKSRYEVISNLEEQKRSLVRERDNLTDSIKDKERDVKNLVRVKEDIAKQKVDFDMKQGDALQKLAREKSDFNFRIANTEDEYDRKIVDAKEDLEYFKSQVENKKKTVNELIKGVDESLERFGKLQTK